MRNLKPLFVITTAVNLLIATQISMAQQDVTVPDNNIDFGTDIGFDDSIFAGAFDKDADETDSWLDDFTIKVSQQFFGQVNNHGVEVAPGFSFPRKAELENNRLGINVRYQNSFAPGWLLQASGQAKAYWNDDYEYEANGERIDTDLRINELFLQHSFDQHSIKFGRQTVVWGETLGNSVLDVINTTEFRDLTIIDIEDARLNQWMVVWDYFGESGTFSTFVNLYPEFNPAPHRGSPFFFEPQFNLTDYDRDGDTLFEIGTQWRMSFEGSDIAFMAAYLYENQLRYDDPPNGMGDAFSEKNDFLLLGFSANRAMGKLLLNFDLAFSRDVLADSFNFPGTSSLVEPLSLKKDQVGTSFGFEYAISNDQSISVGVQAQTLLDEKEGLLPGQELVNDGIFGSALMRYSNTLMNGDLVISSTVQGGLDGDSLLVMLGIDYTLNDYWAINSQVISINAASDSPLVFFSEDVRLGATITYSF